MNPLAEILNEIEAKELWERDLLVERNEFIIKAGEINTNLYFVESGSVNVFVVEQDEEQSIRFGYQNSFFGALDSFLSDKPTHFYFQAIKQTYLKVISKIDFMELINQSEKLMWHWQQIMGELIVQQMERERDLLTNSPKERYLRVLKRSPQLFQEIPSKYIASYLRMTPETLSRIKKG
ncbi:Crp/Fnr family transcriptional regulator [Crocinitomix sp.]|nr:Crp/Fnr family transcriptional regulator [Crocinitomix sp.]